MDAFIKLALGGKVTGRKNHGAERDQGTSVAFSLTGTKPGHPLCNGSLG